MERKGRMPTYQYSCNECQEFLEIVQSFTDNALTICPSCNQPELRKVYGAVGVVFKGSGFYKTDSRSTQSSPAKAPQPPSSPPSTS